MYSNVAEGARISPSMTRCGALRIFQRATALAHSPGISASADQPRAGILAALGVVGRGRGHAMRPFPGADLHHRVKSIDGKRPAGRIAADLVQREQTMVAIERGVLQRLRHHRPGELLHLQRETPNARRAVRRRGRA